MWDVKEIPQVTPEVAQEGFTLTMWDVKETKLGKASERFIKFYLNYVGCKVYLVLNF